jgi:hypothetical protein
MINKIKGLRKYTDCSMPSNEAERINKAEVSAYNQAIEDVVKLFCQPAVIKSVCDYPWHDSEINTVGGCIKCGEDRSK